MEQEDAEPVTEKKRKAKKSVKEEWQHLQNDLESLYNTKVQIKSLSRGKGSITFKFKSEEELNRISEILKNKS